MERVSAHTHLYRHDNGRYYFYRRIPKGVREAFPGRVHFKEALGTSDVEEAKRLVRLRSLAADQEIEEARKRLSAAPVTDLSAAEIDRLAALYYADLLEFDETARIMGFRKGSELERWNNTIADLKCGYQKHYARGDAELVEAEAGALFDHKGISIPPKGTDAYSRLFRECHKQWIRAAEAIQKWNQGEIIDTPEVALPAKQEKARPKPGAGEAPTITELWAIWLREKQPSPKLEIEWKAAARRFTDLKGDVPVTEVTRDDALDFRDHLAQLPGRRRAKMAPGTVRKQLTAMSTLFQVAIERRITDRNPFERLKVADEGAADEREPFTMADLRTIFSAPMSGNRDTDRWLPLLALYTGARPEELAQLKIADVRADDEGFRYFDITNEPGNNLKEGAGNRRKVPVHPAIVACGFLSFWEQRSRSTTPDAWLFSDVEKSKRDKLSEAFSKRFGRHLRAIGIIDPDKVFYSFRHTFKSQGRACEIDEPILDALQGHAPRHVGGRYGLGKARIPYPLSVLAKEIEKLTFPGLEVDTLPAFQGAPKRLSSGAPLAALQGAGQ